MERKKRRRAYDVPGDAHELTFSTYRRLPLLERSTTKELFLKCLDRARKRLGFRIVAYVVMPEHVHLLVFPDGKPIAALLIAVKSEFAKQLLCELRSANASILEQLRVIRRDGTSSFRIWQAGGGYDRNLFSPSAIRAAIDYIHSNPVRRGLCDTIVGWKWSSARWYHGLEVDFDVERFE